MTPPSRVYPNDLGDIRPLSSPSEAVSRSCVDVKTVGDVAGELLEFRTSSRTSTRQRGHCTDRLDNQDLAQSL
eukprot:CAMPEP_0206434364 /NCGR_PEP_ID=MMETSP0324_2-20121206/9114_1 /ASSEMBLY_ACC=CAM_ASM_000836 /TAXON_ID=2866 /ORGANISM="Crypthecodinium cohnii, Strain Seligo" /LENGTH=72 /DNA_ID=CAMNT_0053900865 /DNA_START=295 /DNA_END=513 /DNA_ORIENTATION=-